MAYWTRLRVDRPSALAVGLVLVACIASLLGVLAMVTDAPMHGRASPLYWLLMLPFAWWAASLAAYEPGATRGLWPAILLAPALACGALGAGRGLYAGARPAPVGLVGGRGVGRGRRWFLVLPALSAEALRAWALTEALGPWATKRFLAPLASPCPGARPFRPARPRTSSAGAPTWRRRRRGGRAGSRACRAPPPGRAPAPGSRRRR